MNILDENTKAMLENGGAVILDSKYEANSSFICAMCGGDDIAATVCSHLILETGYGSANDLERVTVPLCGECADRLYVEMTQMPGARIDDIQI